jgi:hypothetical protein
MGYEKFRQCEKERKEWEIFGICKAKMVWCILSVPNLCLSKLFEDSGEQLFLKLIFLVNGMDNPTPI